MKTPGAVLAILYGKGGLGCVGRHAVVAALERMRRDFGEGTFPASKDIGRQELEVWLSWIS